MNLTRDDIGRTISIGGKDYKLVPSEDIGASDITIQGTTRGNTMVGLIKERYRDGEDIDNQNFIDINYYGVFNQLSTEAKNNIGIIVANLAAAYLNKE